MRSSDSSSFNQAIELDPNYALPYAGMADCYTKLGDVGVTALKPKEAFARAHAAALRALEIDNQLAEVHTSPGHLDMHLLRWADAERDLKHAWMIYTNIEPRLDPLRGDPRFTNLLERLGFAA